MTNFIESTDGTRIAFDVIGEGPLLMLLHGGSHDRTSWHKTGYVEQLKPYFRVVTVDLRSSGESDKPAQLEAYHIDRFFNDIHQIADACHAEQLSVWGYSFGGNITRYLASRSHRIQQAVIVGIPFGPAVDARFRQGIESYVAEWTPKLKAYHAGSLDLSQLDVEDVAELKSGTIEAWFYLLQAMLTWDDVSPSEIRCPTLMLVGIDNESVYKSLSQLDLESTPIQVKLLDGLNHAQEFSTIEQVFPLAFNFLTSNL